MGYTVSMMKERISFLRMGLDDFEKILKREDLTQEGFEKGYDILMQDELKEFEKMMEVAARHNRITGEL